MSLLIYLFVELLSSQSIYKIKNMEQKLNYECIGP